MAGYPAKGYKRLTISLPNKVLEAVEALSKAQGIPLSKAITGVLEEFTPAMVDLARFMEQMKAGQKAAAKQTIQHMMGDAMAQVIGQQIDLYPAKKAGKK